MARETQSEPRQLPRRAHSVMIEEQHRVHITGVEDVDSFDESQVTLSTSVGILNILGSELHIGLLNLEDGQLVVEGSIFALEYLPEQQKRGGLFSRRGSSR